MAALDRQDGAGRVLYGWDGVDELWANAITLERIERVRKRIHSDAVAVERHDDLAEGVDPLGYYLGGWGYAYIQLLGDAVKASNGLNDDKLAEYMHSHPFHAIEGDLAFGPEGEWTEARPIWVQYHDIKGHDVEQFREPKTVTILAPAKYKTGEMIYPYAKARE